MNHESTHSPAAGGIGVKSCAQSLVMSSGDPSQHHHSLDTPWWAGTGYQKVRLGGKRAAEGSAWPHCTQSNTRLSPRVGWGLWEAGHCRVDLRREMSNAICTQTSRMIDFAVTEFLGMQWSFSTYSTENLHPAICPCLPNPSEKEPFF